MPAFAFGELYSLTRASRRSIVNGLGQLEELANHQPGLTHDPATLAPLGLLIEPAATNDIRNPDAEGAIAGTFAAGSSTGNFLPNNWRFVQRNPGLQVTVTPLLLGSRRGVRLRYSGTVTANAADTLEFDLRTIIGTTPGDRRSAALSARLVTGSIPAAVALRQQFLDAGGAAFSGSTLFDTPATLTGAWQRLTMTSTVPAAAATGVHGITFTGWSLGPVDFTVELAWPQFERGNATSIILPPAGTTVASSRLADAVSVPDLARAGINTSGHTLLWRGQVNSLPPSGGFRGLWRLDDGSNSNLVYLRVIDTGRLQIKAISSGSELNLFSVGSVTPGVEFTVGAAWGPGALRLMLAGETSRAATLASLPLGLSRMFVGSGALSGTGDMLHGTCSLLHGIPRTLSGSELQTLAAAA